MFLLVIVPVVVICGLLPHHQLGPSPRHPRVIVVCSHLHARGTRPLVKGVCAPSAGAARRGTIHPRGLSFPHGVICGGSRPPSLRALLQFLRPCVHSTSVRVPACGALFRCCGGVLLLCSDLEVVLCFAAWEFCSVHFRLVLCPVLV